MSVKPYLSLAEQRASAILLAKLGPQFPNLTIERCWVNFAFLTVSATPTGFEPGGTGMRGTAIIDVPGGGGLSRPYYGNFEFYSNSRKITYDDITDFLERRPEWYERVVFGIMASMRESGLQVESPAIFCRANIDLERDL